MLVSLVLPFFLSFLPSFLPPPASEQKSGGRGGEAGDDWDVPSGVLVNGVGEHARRALPCQEAKGEDEDEAG